MSSFDEYRKKLIDKYGSSPKKEKEDEESKPIVGASVWDDPFESKRRDMTAKYGAGVDKSKVKNWFTESESTFKNLSEYYKANDGKWTTNFGGDFAGKLDELLNSASSIGFYLRNNKREFSDYDAVSKAYSEYSSVLEQFKKQNSSMAEFYSQFESEDEYNTWYENYKRKQEVLTAEDYEEFSQKGAAIENPTYREADGYVNIFGWRPFGEDVGNIVTFSRDNETEIRFAGNTAVGDFRYAHMTDDEVGIYNYYLAKYGKDKANEYLQSIDDELDLREAGKIAKAYNDNVFLESILGFTAGFETSIEGLKSLADFVTGNESGTDYSPTQYADQIVASDNKGILKGFHDVSSVIGGMTPSILASTLTGNPLVGASLMGGSAMGNAYNEMIDRGYNQWQARGYGLLVGASETTLEYLLGGIGKLGGKLSGHAIGNFVSKFDNAIARTAIQLGGSMVSEGIEEGLQTVIEPALKALITGETFETPEWEDVWYSALLGALSAGVMEGAPTIANTASGSIRAKNIYGTDPKAIVTEALEIDPENDHAKRMKAKLDSGQNISGYQLNRLVEANEQSLAMQDKTKMTSAAEERLTKLGETGDVKKIAEVLVKQASGEDISIPERRIIKNSKFGQRVANELSPQNIQSGEYTSKWAEGIGTERINTEAYNKALYDSTSREPAAAIATEEASATKNPTAKENAVEAKFKASTDGKTRIGDLEVSIKEIASVKNGEVTLRLEDGSTVDAMEVEFGSPEETKLYGAVANMNVNAATANAFIKGYDHSIGVDEYALGFREAYRYGEYGFPIKEMTDKGFSASLAESQRMLAYNLGRNDAKFKIAAKQKTVSSLTSETADKKTGKVYYEEGFSAENLTQRQQASLKGIETLANALGVDFRIFESQVVDGKRQGANGWFDRRDGSIHIDLHAGLNGEGTMLFTASHELTHFIREWSPEKFKVFADSILEEYGNNNVSVEALVSEQIAKAKRNGRDIDYDTAYEEVIADSCEAMLSDGDIVGKIAKIKSKDKSLWKKIRDFITDLVDKIKAAYKGMKPDSVEGRFVSEMLDKAEKLKALWTEALVDASDTYASADKTLFDNGIVIDTNTESASLMSVRDLLNSEQQQQVAQTLADRFGVTVEEAKGWISAETSLASLILNPKYSQYLDYVADSKEEAIKSNYDYPQGTVDFSNICKKRRDFTEVMNRVLRNFPNHVFEATDLAKIRTIMSEEGMEVACGICYVEDRRQLDSIVAQDFIDSLALYRKGSKTRPDGKAFNTNQIKALKLIDGDSYVPSIYELVSLEGRNSLKAKNPAMEEAWVKFNNARGMQSVRLLLNDAEYKRQILDYKPTTVKRKNDFGGLRIYSFSDMEMFHLIDIIQVITDSATVGLSIQGYTKVNEYAKAVKDTGEKLNRSLIPKGDLGYHVEDGRIVLDFDTVEGIDVNHPDFFDNIDNPNIGNIVIGINAKQIKAAMTSKFIDQIIPFHTGQSNDVLGEKGIATWVNYKDFQSERDLSTGKKSSHQINIYTEVIQAAEAEGKPITNKVEFVNKFLQVCKENNLEPRFSEFLNVDENGDYIYTEGYHKFLVDFKTFDQNTGEYLPQLPVKPIFDNAYITQLLKDYVKTQQEKDAKFSKVAPKVLDRITNEIVKPKEKLYSDRDSLGNELSAEQQEFFKNSKVRDKKGNLMVLYHGTTANFNTFKKGDVGFHFGTKGAARGRVGFGKNVNMKEVYLNITNPIVFDEDLGSWDADYRLTRELYDKGILTQAEAESVLFTDDRMYKRTTETANRKLASVLIEKGYDGISYPNTFETKKATTSYIVFNSNQAKEISNKAPTSNPDIRYSDRDSYAPTFYSHMGKVVDGIKSEKVGANGVVPYLKGKGVKAEEIKWSGIETFLEDKKSVTKAELQEFVAGSQLQIEEEISKSTFLVLEDGTTYDSAEEFRAAAYALADEKGIDRKRVEFENYYDEAYVAIVDEDIDSPLLEAEINSGGSRWSQYKLDGGKNYRELVFKMPNATYSNSAMKAHWGENAEGVLAHARIQDLTTTDGKNMLFIEEIQSDWHNEGKKEGYIDEAKSNEIKAKARLLGNEYKEERQALISLLTKVYEGKADNPEAAAKTVVDFSEENEVQAFLAKKYGYSADLVDRLHDFRSLRKEYRRVTNEWQQLGIVPDAPFRTTYHEFVLKRLLRMAAEEGYDSIGWTTADIQSQRWSDEYAEGYRIEYDQDIPSFLKKYGKKWGATVGNTTIPSLSPKTVVYDVNRQEEYVSVNAWKAFVKSELRIQGMPKEDLSNLAFQESEKGDFVIAFNMATGIEYDRAEIRKTSDSVWSMDIPDSMKDSVLHNGQVLYSDRYQSADANTDILSMVEKVGKGNFKANDKIDLGIVSDTTAAEIQNITGINVKGFKIAIEARQIEHIIKRHGTNGKADKSMANSTDIAKIGYTLENYDDIRSAGKTRAYKQFRDGNSVWVDTVLYEKEIGSKSYYVVQAVPDTKAKTLYIVTAYIGKKGYKKEASQFIDEKIPDATPKSEIAITSNSIISQSDEFVNRKFSDRDPDSVSNRSLLANALENVARNDVERRKLEEYKSKIALIESEQAKLADLRAKIKELSFAKGKRDTEAIKKLQFEANQSANRINTYDKQLLNLESTKALKDVLEREKQVAYKKAEQRGKEALAAYRERSIQAQRDLMTRYQESRKKGVDSRHRTAMRHKIKDVVSELNKYLLKGTKDKHVPIELQKAVAEALSAVNMDTVGAEERLAKIQEQLQKDPLNKELQETYRRISEQGERMDGKLQALKNAYDDIVNSNDPLISNAHDEVISDTIDSVIKEVGSTPLRDMTLSQLESVYDMYKMVLTTIRNANKAFKAAKSEEISTIANRVMGEINSAGKAKPYRTKVSQAISRFDWNNLKPVYAFERIGSNTFTEVFNNVRAGEDTWAVDISEAKNFSIDQQKKFHYDSWDFKKRYSFTSSSGMHFELSLDQIMSLYAYSKREQARDHLKKGGIVIDETTEVTVKNKLGIPVKFNPTEATAYNISDETLGDIIGKLTTEQRAFVDVMQDYLSITMGEKGNEVSLALYDVKLYKEKNYFPLKSAQQFMAKAKEQQKGEVKIKNSGFSKETVRNANNPIVLTPFMDVWADHVNEMSMYHAFVLPLEDFYRVYNYKTPTSDTTAIESVEMYLQNAFGKGATQYIDQLLKDLNGGARVDPTAGIINKLTGLFKKSAVFASLSVVVQQPAAIARAAAIVDMKHFIGKPLGNYKSNWAEIKKYAPVAIIKEMGYFDTGMGQSTIDWIKDEKTWKDKLDDIVSKAPAIADELSWCSIWNAIKRETLQTNKNLRSNSEEFLKIVGERFTEVITKTQVYDSVLSRSANMRSKDTGMKMATAFMAEPTTSINMLENALIQGKRGNKVYARKAVGSVIASMILNSVLVSFVYAGRDDDEEKTYTEKYISTLAKELIDSFNPLTLIPFVKDIVSIAQGYDVERSDMAVITDIINAWNNLENDNRSVYRKVEDFAGAIAAIFGLPVKNIMRDARGIYNTINSSINGEKTTVAGIGVAVSESVTGKEKSNGQQLYEAILSGDTAHAERVKGRFEDQKAIDSAIRKALRDNDPRIKQAAEARYSGNIAEYMRIAKVIIAEGNFSQDNIVSAINSEITLMKNGGGSSNSTTSNKIKSIYEMSDYYSALVGSDQATAYIVKEDLIKTDVANGKDRDKAEADFNSKFASHIRDLYEAGNISDSTAEDMLVNYGGKSEEEARAKIQYWNFKQQYPDYDLSEESVTKYYTDIEPTGIDVDVYYSYNKQKSKCTGTDSDGDGKADSGSVKSEVLEVIDSLPITDEQKDALYYLNGWAASTIWQAPWH